MGREAHDRNPRKKRKKAPASRQGDKRLRSIASVHTIDVIASGDGTSVENRQANAFCLLRSGRAKLYYNLKFLKIVSKAASSS